MRRKKGIGEASWKTRTLGDKGKGKRRCEGSVARIHGPSKLRWQSEKPDKHPVITRRLSPEEIADLSAKPYSSLPESKTPIPALPVVPDRVPPAKPVRPTGPPRDPRELRYSADLAKRLSGETEVSCEAGRVDVLTRTQVIEVKIAVNWKHAIGQVLVYSAYFPGRTPTIHFLARRHCDRLGIRIETEDEIAT